MMERTLNKDLPPHVGQTVGIAGWVDVRRDHGKLIFLDIRDRSGIVQVVVTPKAAEALETAKELRAQWVVEIEGEVKARPEATKGEGPLGGIELSAQSIKVLSRAHELPFELGTEVNLDTHLDH
ncbi:MAG: OB-fold nucleic acid binding domain-containing protein, partial [Patescibacteria group bacterium]